MARAFSRRRGRLVAHLDRSERAVVGQLAEQVLELIEPAAGAPAPGEGVAEGSEDGFDAIVAGIGQLSTDVGEPAPERSTGLEEDRDPALDRLFPAGHREDPEAAREFRRLTEPGLRSRKASNLQTLLQVMGRGSGNPADPERLSLDEGEAVACLVALTDIRLVMGERLGLRTDDDALRLDRAAGELDEEDPAAFAIMLYDFLTWLQESLGRALSGDL